MDPASSVTPPQDNMDCVALSGELGSGGIY